MANDHRGMPQAETAPAAQSAEKTKSAQAKERELEAAKAPTRVVLTHGKYVDHTNYVAGDEDHPPAVAGDEITVPKRVADRMIREGVARAPSAAA